jgi:hypothetical protein
MKSLCVKFLCTGAAALIASLTLPAMAQTAPTETDMQILAQKVKADKKLLVAVNMQLTDAEAKGFWPIYDAYQRDLESVDGRLLNVITAYAAAYNDGAVPNDLAKHLIDEYLAIGQDEANMSRSYVPKLAEVLPGVKTARYLQIETKIRAVTRYELAGRIPLVE